MEDKNITNGTVRAAPSAPAPILPDSFLPVSFTALDKIIDGLGQNSAALTPIEKQQATAAIERWEDDVIRRIDRRIDDAKGWLNVLTMDESNCSGTMAILKQLTEATGLDDDYKTYEDLTYAVLDMSMAKPQPVAPDNNGTVEDAITAEHEYKKQLSLYKVDYAKAETAANMARRTLVRKLNRLPQVKELISRLTAYQRNAAVFRNDCSVKSQMASISVSIDNEDVRELLKDMVNFSLSI